MKFVGCNLEVVLPNLNVFFYVFWEDAATKLDKANFLLSVKVGWKVPPIAEVMWPRTASHVSSTV